MRKLLMIGGGSFVLLVAILFGAFYAGPLLASASTSSSSKTSTTVATPTTNAYCTQYQSDLAKRLNVSVSTLQQAEQAASTDVINQMVKDGKLTQAQATQIEQNMANKQACNLPGLHGPRGGHGLGFAGGPAMQKYMSTALTDVAKGLNLTSAQLTSDLQSGKSLSAIATAQGVSATQLQTLLTNTMQSILTQAVSNGDLTQTQANTIQQQFKNNPQFLQHLLNGHSFGMPGRFGGAPGQGA